MCINKLGIFCNRTYFLFVKYDKDVLQIPYYNQNLIRVPLNWLYCQTFKCWSFGHQSVQISLKIIYIIILVRIKHQLKIHIIYCTTVIYIVFDKQIQILKTLLQRSLQALMKYQQKLSPYATFLVLIDNNFHLQKGCVN